MERVVTINLNGNPFQLDESAYEALSAYLKRAEAALAANPDKAEILGDLEQAIADKCTAFLSAHKSVVSAAEIARVIAQMGPVEGEARAEGASGADMGATKRLYRIRDRSSVTGVSAGLAAYFALDVDWIRVGWVLGTLVTGGLLFVPYIVLMFVMPLAATPEQVAAAHGAPFNAEEIIERAKREYARFAEDGAQTFRSERRRGKESMRAHWRGDTTPVPPAGYATRISAGLLAFVLSMVTVALLVGFLVALVSLLNTGTVLGWAPHESVPNWLAILALLIGYGAFSAPINAMLQSSMATASGRVARHHGDGAITFILIAIGVWLAYLYVPDARVWIEHVRDVIAGVIASF